MGRRRTATGSGPARSRSITIWVPRAVAAPAAAPVAAPAAAPVAAPAAAPADPFAVGATVELHGLVSNPAANGRRVVVVQTPPDVSARGRISVNLDGAVRGEARERARGDWRRRGRAVDRGYGLANSWVFVYRLSGLVGASVQ